MNRNTSISLGDYFDNFIQSKISAGRYKNASEIVRAGLRLLEEEENKMIALKAAVQEGIESGIACDFNAELHLKKLKADSILQKWKTAKTLMISFVMKRRKNYQTILFHTG